MQTEPGYFEKTGGYVQAGSFKVPIKNVVKLLAEKGNFAADLETRLTAYVGDRHTLIHRWVQENGRPADEDVEGFAPLIVLANRVAREASELTRQLASYIVTFLGPEGATASAEERKNRMAMIFRSVREEHGAA